MTGPKCVARAARSGGIKSTISADNNRVETNKQFNLLSIGFKMMAVTTLIFTVFIGESVSMYSEGVNNEDRDTNSDLSYDDQLEALHATDLNPYQLDSKDVEESTRTKKWTAPENKSRARVIYNYFLAKGLGPDIFGKRMSSSFPGSRNFRFFAPAVSGGSGFHGSEFLGKRGAMKFRDNNNAPVSEFLGKRSGNPGNMEKRARISEFLGKRARISEFLGKRARVSEFLGKRNPDDFGAMPDKRFRASEFLGKRAGVSEFLGKRSDAVPPNDVEKRTRASEFLGKRARISEFLGKRARISEFLGKRYSDAFKNQMMRSGPSGRVSEFLGKRSVNFHPDDDDDDDQDDSESDHIPDEYYFDLQKKPQHQYSDK